MGKEIQIIVRGPTGSGKSALRGEIEILLRALGVPYRHADPAAAEQEARTVDADWIKWLEIYKPTVVLIEENVPGIPLPVLLQRPATELPPIDPDAGHCK